jgi:hypothetical protein
MCNDAILTTAWLIQEERIRRAMHALLIAEAGPGSGLTTRIRVWIGTFLMHLGGRLLTTRRPASAPWRTVHVARNR